MLGVNKIENAIVISPLGANSAHSLDLSVGESNVKHLKPKCEASNAKM